MPGWHSSLRLKATPPQPPPEPREITFLLCFPKAEYKDDVRHSLAVGARPPRLSVKAGRLAFVDLANFRRIVCLRIASCMSFK